MWFKSSFSAGSAGLCLVTVVATTSAYALDEITVTDARMNVQRFQLSYMTMIRAPQGKFDAFGTYVPYPDGSTSVSWANTIEAAYRFSSYVDVGFRLMAMESSSTFPSGSMTMKSFGSPSVDSRFHIGGWPHLIAHLGASLPFRTRSLEMVGNPGKDSLSDDSSGDGSGSGPSVRVGLGGSRTFRGSLPLRVALDATVGFPIAQWVDSQDGPVGTPPTLVRNGNQLAFTEGLAYILSDRWNISAGMRQTWALDKYSGGAEVLASATRGYTTNAGVTYSPSSHWRWTAKYDTQFPFYAYAVNQPYSPSVSLMMLYQ